jgi:antiviral defense system Shedu protein SduA
MKAFRSIAFDFLRSEKEVDEFEKLLQNNTSLQERKDILPFFRKREQLCAMCSVLSPEISVVDRVALEYDLFGDFACDLALGDWDRKAYCFIEFEDAEPQSIFEKAGKKANRNWGRRFEHGYSQIIDWFHKLTKMAENPEFEGRFGKRTIAFDAALVIGRDADLVATEISRLEWRQEFVVVHSKRIRCVTFDGLLRLMRTRLRTFALMADTANAPTPPAPQ